MAVFFEARMVANVPNREDCEWEGLTDNNDGEQVTGSSFEECLTRALDTLMSHHDVTNFKDIPEDELECLVIVKVEMSYLIPTPEQLKEFAPLS